MDWGNLALLAIGLAAGIISSLFGVGGGILIVPALHYGLGIEFRLATVTSLAAIAIQAPIGVLQHARKGAVSWRLGIELALGGAVGVAVGVLLQPRTPVAGLKAGLAALMVFAAWRMVAAPLKPHAIKPASLLVVGLGSLAGIASRLLGIGGGLVTVPVLALAGTPMHQAVASSLVPVFTNSLLAAAVAIAIGFDPVPALWVGAGAIPGAILGVKVAHALRADRLKQVFAAALGVAALAIGATSGAFQ
ncbi:MAG: sulfite exporter TauE/SafE family protein [Candidatus Thermoplasmatota archaeon]